MGSEKQEFSRNIVRYIGRLEKLRRRYLNERLKAYKLKGSMFLIVLFLDKNPGSSQDALGEFLGIDKSGVARKCRTMDDLGYIRREQSEENRRQNKLYLTDSGRGLLPVIRELLANWSDSVTCGMNETEEKELIRLLELMMDNAIKNRY